MVAECSSHGGASTVKRIVRVGRLIQKEMKHNNSILFYFYIFYNMANILLYNIFHFLINYKNKKL